MCYLPEQKDSEFIDVSATNQVFPIGEFIAYIHDDDKDEDVFNLYIDESNSSDQDIENWSQYMIGKCDDNYHTSDGQTVFMNTKSGEILITPESIVKLASDVTFFSDNRLISDNKSILVDAKEDVLCLL